MFGVIRGRTWSPERSMVAVAVEAEVARGVPGVQMVRRSQPGGRA